MPADRDPLVDLWCRAPALSAPAAAFTSSTLPLRELEVARATIAAINDCEEVPVGLYDHVIAGDLQWSGLSEREGLAGTFARMLATDHLAIDDDLWPRIAG